MCGFKVEVCENQREFFLIKFSIRDNYQIVFLTLENAKFVTDYKILKSIETSKEKNYFRLI